MISEDGTRTAWRARLGLWGETEALTRRAANDNAAPDCPIRFQGQWFDEESGLHYNRFRYYDPEAGQYLSPDPIGLAGGERPQWYVADPNGWVDPLGLSGCGGPRRPGGYQVHDRDSHGRLSPNANRAPGHANTAADGRIQSHHAIQQEWAKRNVPGYDPDAAPAVLLPSSSGMSHAQISSAQRAFRRQNGYGTDIRTEFSEAARQMRAAGVPESTLRLALSQNYKYFDNLGAFD